MLLSRVIPEKWRNTKPFPLFNKISPLSKDQIDTNNRENLEISLFLLEKTRRPAPYQNEYSRAFG